MITEAEIEKACAWLRDNAAEAAQARANRIYIEEYRKALKANLMKKHASESIGAQEREAYSAPEYKEFLEGLKEAVRLDEYNRFMRAAAVAKIEAWRTQEANRRGMDRLG